MPLAGGPSTVAGTRYEYRWTALRFLDVLFGEAASIRVEPPGEDGFEFVLTRPEGAREFHQVKRSHTKGTWTLGALESAGVLAAFIKKLAEEPDSTCLFFSGAEARDLRELAERSRASLGLEEFQSKFLTSELQGGFQRIVALSGSAAAAYEQLRRVRVRTGDEDFLLELGTARCRYLFGSADPRIVVDILAQLAMDKTHVPLDARALRGLLQERGLSPTAEPRPGTWYRPPPWPIPQRPAEYLPRDELKALKLSLISGAANTVAITSQHQRLAIQGMPGVGKTMLAVALATDPDIQEAFPGGVFWLTLGQTPDPPVLWQATNLATHLKGAPVEINTPGVGQTLLAQLFAAHPPALLILDDVWRIEHATPFNAIASPSRVLITTRDRSVAFGLGADVRDINELEAKPALALLAAYAARSVDALPVEAPDIVRECGELPLALAMAGSMLRGRPDDRWSTLLAQLRKADLEYLAAELPAYHNHRNMLAAIEVSVQELPKDVRHRFLDFAVFAEDVAVPEAVVHLLWKDIGVDLAAAQRTVDVLVDRSLVRRDAQGRLTLHDLQHDYVRARGGDIKARHAQLLAAYRNTTPDRALHAVASDGYFFEHIARHVRNGEGPVALRALLFDHRWLAAKLKATGVNALLADFELLDLASDAPLRLLRDALRLSAHVLSQHREELPSQLLGRLRDASETELQRLCEHIEADVTSPILLPVWPCLHPPGEALLRTLQGHAGGVNAVALSVDGKTVVSSSSDRTLRVWGVETGEERRSLRGHAGVVNAVVLSADRKMAVSGSSDGTLRVWDVEVGEERRTLRGHTSGVNAVVLGSDGRTAISGSWGRTLKVWDVQTGELRRTLQGHTGWVNAVVLSSDGKTAISSSSDGTLKVWNVETGEERRTLRGHDGGVNAVALSADGRTAVSGSSDRTLKVWDVETGELRRTLQGHDGGVNAVVLSTNARTVVSGSSDKTLKVWNVETGELRRTLQGHAGVVSAVALSADGRTAVSGSSDGTLKVWDMEMGEARRARQSHAGVVSAVVLSADGKTAVSGSSDGTLKVWDVEKGQEHGTLRGHATGVKAVALSMDGKTAVSGSGGRALKVWDVETGEQRRTLQSHAAWVNAVALSMDGKTAVSGSGDKTLKVWDLETGELRRTLQGHTDWVNAVVLSVDGKTVVSGSSDETLKVWDVETGEEYRTLQGHAGRVNAVALSADGKTAISGSSNGTLKAWDMETGEERRTLRGHADGVNAVALSADGKTAISGSDDKTLKAWNVETGACLISFTGGARFHAVALSPARRVFAGDSAGHVHLLELRLGPDRPVDRGRDHQLVGRGRQPEST